jgi:hypothetical protein
MKAISTRFMPATNYRGARMIASDGDRNKISIPYPHELNSDEAHAFAAKTLRDKMKWKGEMIGGAVKGGMCFVFANSEPRFNPSKRLTLDKVRAELRPLGLSIRKRDNEYRVAFTASASPQDRAGIEASAYYTDDLTDAWATGLEMARGQKRNPKRRPRLSASEARSVFDAAARGTDQAYKGYRIYFNALRSEWYVSKGGAHLGTFGTVPEAKRAIDLIASPDRNPARRAKRRVVISGEKFSIARKMADAGIPFIFVREAGGNVVGDVPNQHIAKLRKFGEKHPDIEMRFARLENSKQRTRSNPLPMFPMYARKKTGDAWSMVGVFRTLANARTIGNLVRTRGYQVRVTDGKD